MTAFDNAQGNFEAGESSTGWERCKEYVVEGARFSAQSEPLVDLPSIEDDSEGMAVLGTETVPGATCDRHTSPFCAETRSAAFFATFHAEPTGGSGPVPPTHPETSPQSVYTVDMNVEDKVERMTKIWTAPWAMRKFGGA